MAPLPVTLAFLQWLSGQKGVFKVTPKGKAGGGFTIHHLYFSVILSLLLISILIGTLTSADLQEASLFYAYLVNLFWAGWFLTSPFALYVSLAYPVPREVRERVGQTYEGLEGLVVEMFSCAMAFESSLATMRSSQEPSSLTLRSLRRYPEAP